MNANSDKQYGNNRKRTNCYINTFLGAVDIELYRLATKAFNFSRNAL